MQIAELCAIVADRDDATTEVKRAGFALASWNQNLSDE